MSDLVFLEKIKTLARARKIEWKRHALKKLLERDIRRTEVFDALENCEIVEAYLHDKPLPRFLLLGFHEKKALHIVVVVDETEDVLWIITVYEPSPEKWEKDLKKGESNEMSCL